jgi:CRP-like cAMP-binding protein
MAASSYLEHLHSVPLFRACNRRELSKIARATDEVHLAAGTTLMEQGSPGREAFVIVSGRASVRVGDREVAELGPGQHVGELALLDGGVRTATVVALTDMDLLVIHQRAFLGLLDEVPGLSRKVLTSLAGMVRDLNEQLDQLATRA